MDILDEEDLEETINRHLADTGLTIRTVNALESCGIRYVSELLQCCGKPTKSCDGCKHFVDERGRTKVTSGELDLRKRTCGRKLKLLGISNFGHKTLDEVFRMLARLGLVRAPSHPTLKKKYSKQFERKGPK